ncbi:hypothetical protein B0H14DRAFT_2605490 [Mycena olivaceomarginata]|nr:hypothetical protein B0H14DRAFT_2605490 [Mycena olivaceomarginata]
MVKERLNLHAVSMVQDNAVGDPQEDSRAECHPGGTAPRDCERAVGVLVDVVGDVTHEAVVDTGDDGGGEGDEEAHGHGRNPRNPVQASAVLTSEATRARKPGCLLTHWVQGQHGREVSNTGALKLGADEAHEPSTPDRRMSERNKSTVTSANKCAGFIQGLKTSLAMVGRAEGVKIWMVESQKGDDGDFESQTMIGTWVTNEILFYYDVPGLPKAGSDACPPRFFDSDKKWARIQNPYPDSDKNSGLRQPALAGSSDKTWREAWLKFG